MSTQRKKKRMRGRRGGKHINKKKVSLKFEENIYSTQDSFFCRICMKKSNTNDLFSWSDCHHQCCGQCAANIIHESLSLKNEMPKCSHQKCNQSLKSEHADSIQSLLLNKYQIKQDIINYNLDEYLIYGYVRDNYSSTPTDIILTILNFFNLIYFSKIVCYKCQGYGEVNITCSGCGGYGYRQDCQCCGCKGIIKHIFKCEFCKGSGLLRCFKCSGSGKYVIGQCRKCQGKGRISNYDEYDWENCNLCGGDGKYGVSCNGCGGSGRDKDNCYECCGNGTLEQVHKCYACRGNGYTKKKRSCKTCCSTGEVTFTCSRCDGAKKIVILDLNKLIHLQSFCVKCNQFFPNDLLISWSKCDHRYCNECMSTEIAKKTKDKKSRVCALSKCNKIMGSNTLDLTTNMFLCTYCNTWHLKIKENIFSWSKCEHEYNKNCAKLFIEVCLESKSHTPKCKSVHCNEILLADDVKIIGINSSNF
eukprot:207767_1